MPEVIRYTPSLAVANVSSLPRGLGLPYLECVRSHTGELIAKSWRKAIPADAEVVIAFKGKRK